MKFLCPAVAALTLSACSGGSSGSGADEQTGTLSLAVTDAPVDEAAAVVVKFTAIELKPQNGAAITIDLSPHKSIDLLALAGGGTADLLNDQTVPAGRYEWMRLMIEAEQNQSSSYIDLMTGERFPLYVPSGSETGLKLVRGFTVAVGGHTDFTIDFDLRKSVVAPPGRAPNYVLKPALRLIDSLEVGTLSGTVDTSLIGENCSPFVYVYAGSDVVPDDMDATPDEIDPVISVPVELDTVSGEYRYRVAFLEAGPYTVSFTCDGEADTADGEETLDFAATMNATVSADATASISF